MPDIQAVDTLEEMRLVPCIACTFWLEEKHQREKSKSTGRIREQAYLASRLGCACPQEGSQLRLRMNCKSSL